MSELFNFNDHKAFSKDLYVKMQHVHPGISDLEWYEFDYALDNLAPSSGWDSVPVIDRAEISSQINQIGFFKEIQLKPLKENRIIPDEKIASLTRTLFKGLVSGAYSPEWINSLFYFDVRGFLFFVRTRYFSPEIINHFGGKPFLEFEKRQNTLEACQDIGYREFAATNREIDQAFIGIIEKLINVSSAPFLLTIAGPSGAGKTEIVDRLRLTLSGTGKSITAVEMDNFYKDGDFRDGKVLDENVIHFELFRQSLSQIMQGKPAIIPRYNFLTTASSHDLDGNLRLGEKPIEITPADVVFLEGNFPFHLPEIAKWIGVKIVYLTDDPIRLKRKWRRDIDYRKKYDQVYFCNRYFRTQFLRAQEVYRPLMEVCDIVVDTTSAALWLTPDLEMQLTTASINGSNHW
jgi:uridine kinase